MKARATLVKSCVTIGGNGAESAVRIASSREQVREDHWTIPSIAGRGRPSSQAGERGNFALVFSPAGVGSTPSCRSYYAVERPEHGPCKLGQLDRFAGAEIDRHGAGPGAGEQRSNRPGDVVHMRVFAQLPALAHVERSPRAEALVHLRQEKMGGPARRHRPCVHAGAQAVH